MKIEYTNWKYYSFKNIPIGTAFRFLEDVFYLKLSDEPKNNALNLKHYHLVDIMPDEFVFPVKSTLTITDETPDLDSMPYAKD